MATYTTLAPGSRGDQVRRLQTRLNGHGADLKVDGVYGPKTGDAVRRYQTARGLKPDGVATQATWKGLMEGTAASLPSGPAAAAAAPGAAAPYAAPAPKAAASSASSAAASSTTAASSAAGHMSQATADALAQYEAGYTPGAEVDHSRAAWEALLSGGPGGYQSPYEAELAALYDRIAGREGFSYDPENDPLYRQYRDQYVRLGRRAMDDTLGRAAGLTGGYASSYGQSVGQQAYDEYLQELNGKVPELYSLALDRYNAEGDELARQYGLLRDAEASAYDRWRDEVGDWRADADAAWRRYADAADDDYDRWYDMLKYWRGRAGDESDEWWKQTEWDYQRERDAVDDDHWERQFAQRIAAAAARSGGGSAPAGAAGADESAADTDEGYTGPYVHVPPYGYIPASAARDMVARGQLEWVMKDDRRTVLTDKDGNPIARAPKSPYHGTFTALN